MAAAANIDRPDPRTFDDDLLKILAVLAVAKIDGSSWLADTEISRRLRDDHGIALHWRTIRHLLLDNKNLVARKHRRKNPLFSIMAAGEERVSSASPSIMLVDPEHAMQSVSTLHKLLSDLKGVIRICDPYVDPATIEHLDACPAGVPIRLLTEKAVRDEGRVRRLLEAARVQGRTVELRIAGGAQLHDRYIIADDVMLLLGTSLNGFGKRQHFVSKVGPDIRDLTAQGFDQKWDAAARWWP